MPDLRIGSLCSGMGGLEMGVQSVMGGTTTWVSDIDKGACKILAHRFPGVPNIGDMTAVDWSAVEPVDLICGGTPCQDLSHAGARRGMTEGTRSNLWVSMREAIATIRPKYVIWENVRGAASAEADSDLVNQPGLLAGVRRRDGQPLLRALGRVVGDLSDLGYVGQIRGLRAADVGAPHGRFRYFILATDATSDQGRVEHRDGALAADARDGAGHGERSREEPRQGSAATVGALLPTPVADNSRGLPSSTTDYASLANAVCALLPTPRAGDGDKGGPNQRGSSGDLMLPSAVQLLPSPTARDWRDHKTLPPDAVRGKDSLARALHGMPPIEAQKLLPTLRVKNNENRQSEQFRGEDGNFYGLIHNPERWGQYAAAIQRWEALTRPAPPPTETGHKGNPRLSAAFSEWMMGLPTGWVTDVPGITRNEALRALGNGVVPQQCAAALAEMLSWQVAA